LISPYSLGKLIDWKRSDLLGLVSLFDWVSPYSLGKLIDWKLPEKASHSPVLLTPYSLGKLIDWKLAVIPHRTEVKNISPYSLGKLIDWKRFSNVECFTSPLPPYSLGKLIDWKHDTHLELTVSIKAEVHSHSLLAREIN
jgi:hypothetical protein